MPLPPGGAPVRESVGSGASKRDVACHSQSDRTKRSLRPEAGPRGTKFASEPAMSLARSVAEVLDQHVTLELECIDRMYLNVY
jgi:hypothetical protein